MMPLSIVASWERLAPRERRLVSLAGGIFGAMLTLVVTYLIYDGLATLEDRNTMMRDALAQIDKNREQFSTQRRLATAQESRISRTPLQLVTLVEGAARDIGITAHETNDQTPLPHGKKYLQKGVEVKFRQIDLVQLTKFMKRLETGPNLVYVSRLRITTRFKEHDKLDAEIIVSAFEHAPDVTPKGKKPPAGSPAGTPPGTSPGAGDKGPEKT